MVGGVGGETSIFDDEDIGGASFGHLTIPVQNGFLTTAIHRLLFGEDSSQQVEGLDITTEPAQIRFRDRTDTLSEGLKRTGGLRCISYHLGTGLFREGMVSGAVPRLPADRWFLLGAGFV